MEDDEPVTAMAAPRRMLTLDGDAHRGVELPERARRQHALNRLRHGDPLGRAHLAFGRAVSTVAR
ncbi:hypothetical protein BE04_01280 [Sorangium cellulosum]|uniref:Uncharacterized protein n=2 Tax=Sorangium cellulosum TaxID=56 RepID=A0A150P5K0_SORCE|nr:hypothetical protein SCE1572_09070 [Sorangium cellulosum So0157-2]KYF50945.1 hypothetical protein BE04_01280 [Sorangium cellulosum]